MANEAQLYLLVDHIKFILLEHENAAKDGSDIASLAEEATRSLLSLKRGLDGIGTATHAISSQGITDLHIQYQQLDQRFSSLSWNSPEAQNSQHSSYNGSFGSVRDHQPDALRASSSLKEGSNNTRDSSKFVRFSDAPSNSDTSRDALLLYRDDPEIVQDQKYLSNQQIHAYHGQVLEAQNDQLDDLGQSLNRQRELSIQIGDELDEQGEMLDQMDEYATRHQTQLDRARDRLGRIARKAKDNLQITTIVILIIILVLSIVILK